MRTNRKLLRAVALVLLAGASGGPRLLTAQTEILDDACKFRTRWKDAYGHCKACCDAIENSCPCTT